MRMPSAAGSPRSRSGVRPPSIPARLLPDTPGRPPPEMRLLEATAEAGEPHGYRVIAVNGEGLESTASSPAGPH